MLLSRLYRAGEARPIPSTDSSFAGEHTKDPLKKYDGMRYDDFVAARAEKLRRNANWCERLLWPRLEPWGFCWQYPMQLSGLYYLDFYHPDTGLNVEVDGDESHGTPAAKKRDDDRNEDLLRCGITVVRRSNHRVRYELETVVREIKEALEERGWYPQEH